MPKAKDKILSPQAMLAEREKLRRQGLRLVFTNGCFDLLHAGHIDYLQFAREQGDRLLVGINSDSSVQHNKGPKRPIVPEHERAYVLAGLASVDYVVLFEEPEPASLISQIIPDVLVKGADWAEYVSGRETVEANGGRVILADLRKGCSSTNIINKIQQRTS